jgi:hypothetical protein
MNNETCNVCETHRPWIESARGYLLSLCGPRGGWGYLPDTAPCAEPTALACLGLLGSRGDRPEPHPAVEIERSAGWLVSLQRGDGALGVSAALPAPAWPTPHAILLWAALDGFERASARAIDWLLAQEGLAIPSPASPPGAVGHDTTLVGWPWVEGTHSWLEPTALAVLALRRAGKDDHPRVRAGLRLISDRALAGGGWNYGNRAAFGHDLRPQPGSTGLALLALAGTEAPSRLIEPAITYLLGALPATCAPLSLCWGVLGLRAWDRLPGAAENWLARALAQTLRRPPLSPRLAHLLLAAGPRSLELLGVPPRRVGTAHHSRLTENRHG